MRRSLNSPGRTRPVNWLAEGALAACLGVATVAMLVLLLWIASPYPHGGPGEVLRIATGLWLLAHGVELVRAETLGGGSAPVGLTPLLLTALPVVLLYRVARAARAAEGASWRIVLWLSAGYLLVAGLGCWYGLGGPLRVDPLSAAVRLPLITVAPIGVGVWAALGWPPPSSVLRLPNWLPWARVFTALRAAVAAIAVLCAGGALLAAVAIGLHWEAAADTFSQLTAAWSGRVAVLLLCLALAPNAALWAASYGLGPGFTIGGGSVVGPLAATGYPQLPHFPLLAAVPAEGGGGVVVLAAVAVLPVSAGVVAGWFAARGCVPVRGSDHGAAGVLGALGTVVLAAVGCGLGMALLSTFAGGPLGTGALAGFGPNGWASGATSLGWTALVALPTVLWARWWRLKEPQPVLALVLGGRRCASWLVDLVPRRRARVRPESDWHATGSRHSRWAALKRASGGLMPDLGGATSEPADRPVRGNPPVRDAPPVRPKSSARDHLPVRPGDRDEFAMPDSTVRPRPAVQVSAVGAATATPQDETGAAELPGTADPMAPGRPLGLRGLPAPAELSRFDDAMARSHLADESTDGGHTEPVKPSVAPSPAEAAEAAKAADSTSEPASTAKPASSTKPASTAAPAATAEPASPAEVAEPVEPRRDGAEPRERDA